MALMKHSLMVEPLVSMEDLFSETDFGDFDKKEEHAVWLLSG